MEYGDEYCEVLYVPSPLISVPLIVGVGKFTTGRFATAGPMKSCQISAGSVPPATW